MWPSGSRDPFPEMFSKLPLPRRGAEPRHQDVASGAAQLTLLQSLPIPQN